MRRTRAGRFPAILDPKPHDILVTPSIWLKSHHHSPVILHLLSERDLICLPLPQKMINGFTCRSPSANCYLNCALAVVQPRIPSLHPHRLLTSVSVSLSITEAERQWGLVYVGYLAWGPLDQRSNLLTLSCFSPDVTMKSVNSRTLTLWLFLAGVGGSPYAYSVVFLEAQNHPLENWELVSGSSSVKIRFSCRRNHHPFTFNPFFQSFVFHERLRFHLWVLRSPVKVHSLASFAFSNLFLIFQPTHHQF